MATVTFSLIILFIYVALLLMVSIDKFEFEFHLLKSIKYDSVDFFHGVTMTLIYLVGFKNVFSFGENYVLAMTFATLVTDMQWDIMHAIVTIAKVDIPKKNFDYKKHMKNAYRLEAIVISSIFIMVMVLYGNYQPDLKLSTIFIGAEVLMILFYPIIENDWHLLNKVIFKSFIIKHLLTLLNSDFSYTPSPPKAHLLFSFTPLWVWIFQQVRLLRNPFQPFLFLI